MRPLWRENLKLSAPQVLASEKILSSVTVQHMFGCLRRDYKSTFLCELKPNTDFQNDYQAVCSEISWSMPLAGIFCSTIKGLKEF